MADLDDVKEGKDFGLGRPADTQGFFLKGCANYDWGMKNRMSRIFNPKTGRTVMLAFDHGYFQGPATGLERIDLDDLAAAGIRRRVDVHARRVAGDSSAAITKPVALRCSGGNSILSELSNETVAVDIEDAVRLGVCAMAAQVYIGCRIRAQVDRQRHQADRHRHALRHPDAGRHGRRQGHGAATPGTWPGDADRRRDRRPLRQDLLLDSGFERVVAGCPVPIVIAGGKKLPELEALEMAYKASTKAPPASIWAATSSKRTHPSP